MANSKKNNLSELVKQLSGKPAGGGNLRTLLSPTQLIDATQLTNVRSPKLGSPGDSKASSIGAKDMPTSINFGRPSGRSTSSSQSGSGWTNLLKESASGGVSGALGGGLESIGGLGFLVSGLLNLFGGGNGKKTPPPLIDFQLPASQEQTMYLSSRGNVAYQGAAEETPNPSTGYTGIYTSPARTTPPSTVQVSQNRNAEIVQAVKNALLNSSSLNDVIAEI
ncbi:MAG: hypothetical protein JO097_15675 [Acidobacteriaceae bacterium]|nr:hypothetical protein [Acidobacteriaceae bacterium]MBV9764783.1 hypothetical protein [Acidobacteriaceae bacterium]